MALDDAYARASRDLGLTSQQAELLCAAVRPAPIKELAARLRCDRSNVTRLVDRAAAHGHAARRGEEDDGRVTVVELTPAGDQLARRFLALLESQTDALISTWPAHRQSLAVELMDEIADALDAGKPKPGRRRRRPSASL